MTAIQPEIRPLYPKLTLSQCLILTVRTMQLSKSADLQIRIGTGRRTARFFLAPFEGVGTNDRFRTSGEYGEQV
jgi:hypothetical protein